MDKMRNEIEDAARKLLAPEAERLGCEIYDILYSKEGGRYYLRVFLHKDSGITFEICEQINHALARLLDTVDIIQSGYILEVSSRGLERHLRTPAHYAGAVGETVFLRLKKAVNNQKNYKGVLLRADGDDIELDVDGFTLRVNIDDITKSGVIFSGWC